jgi:hypothetical protein
VDKETKTGQQTVVASQDAPERRRQGRKRLEKGVDKETKKDAPAAAKHHAAPPFPPALFKRS